MKLKKYTIDSNIPILSSIREDYLKFFLNFLKNINHKDYFITPQVKRELTNLQPSISSFLTFLRIELNRNPNKQIIQIYREIINELDEDEKIVFGKFKNLVEFLQEKGINSKNKIKEFSNKLTNLIGRLLTRNILIIPSESECNLNLKKIKKIKEYLISNKLVDGYNDAQIISELIFFIENENNIDFIEIYTNNLKDFSIESKIWKKHSQLSKIKVLSP